MLSSLRTVPNLRITALLMRVVEHNLLIADYVTKHLGGHDNIAGWAILIATSLTSYYSGCQDCTGTISYSHQLYRFTNLPSHGVHYRFYGYGNKAGSKAELN